MWLLRSLAIALAAAIVAGCSDSKSYSAEEVADGLRAHGFATVAVSSDPAAFRDLLPQGREGSAKVVAQIDPRPRYPPGSGASTGDLVVAALIFDTHAEAAEASCGENVVGACLRTRNVVVLVRERREQAARKTLDDLD